MSRERLPLIRPSGSKTTAQQQRRSRQPPPTSRPHPGPSSVLLPDCTMTPWGGVILSESSFPSIPPLPPPPLPPPPQPTPCSPHRGTLSDTDQSASSLSSDVTCRPLVVARGSAGQGLGARRRLLPQQRLPRPPQLPALRPVSNLSFSRSFTFSFFELPTHQTPVCRAERVRNLMLLLRQIHY